MVSLRRFDNLLRGFRRSQSQGLPDTPELQVEELTRRVAQLEDAVRTLIRHNRAGPDWEVSWELAAGQADDNGVIEVEHSLGYAPNRFVVVRLAVAGSESLAADSWGSVRVFQATTDTVKFQLDAYARREGPLGNRATFFVIPWRGGDFTEART